jgi:disulfide bond formation protein DsbB
VKRQYHKISVNFSMKTNRNTRHTGYVIGPRDILGFMSAMCVGLLAFGLFLQHWLGLEPCPMCIVQRYCLIIVMVISGVGFLMGAQPIYRFCAKGMALFALIGAGVAARQSWLQRHPPEVVSCGRDLFGMIEAFPLQRLLPMIFKGSGDCSKVDWTFLGLSIANWSFICFVLIAITALVLLRRLTKN